ncbi:MAG TPA: hypothetical protein ENG87_03880 [Candidatus Pacearchaeota archaeon]|nr:hypothetical protein [Candidatus Pacearchaeota archaeon]
MVWDSFFEFETFKQQIEKYVINEIRLWEEEFINQRKMGKITDKKPYAILFKVEIYNKIREIYSCDIPFPHDTPKLFGIIIGIDKNPYSRGAHIFNKKEYLKLIEEESGEELQKQIKNKTKEEWLDNEVKKAKEEKIKLQHRKQDDKYFKGLQNEKRNNI